MSEALKRAVKSYENYIERKGVDEKVIDAYVEACRCAYWNENDSEYGLVISKRTKGLIDEIIMKNAGGTFWQLEKWAQSHNEQVTLLNQGYEIYKMESPYLFEPYMFYLEKNRPYAKRFYIPRRKTLHLVANKIQDLEDDKLDVLGVSMPSRTGKSTICIMGMTWVGYRKPNSHSAMGGHSGQLAKRFFKGYDNVVSTPDYTFGEMFSAIHPDMKVVAGRSADPAEYTINLGEDEEFATMSCRGIDGTWTGAIDISSDGYLYVDDLIRDREHALSEQRKENTWEEYQNKMLDRMNDGAKKLLVGTLWSTDDPIERERELNENNDRACFLKIPALNDNDESNFDYEYKGFSTKYYIDMRMRLEPADWAAKFQQEPYVREGLLINFNDLNLYDPKIEHIDDGKTIARMDPAFGGGDSLSMMVIKDMDSKKFVPDWIHDKRAPQFTVPRVAQTLAKYPAGVLRIEANAGGKLLGEKVDKELKRLGANGWRIEYRFANVKMSKEDKISGYSEYVKNNFYFLKPEYQSTDYKRAITEMTTYTSEGKNKHDDAIDVATTAATDFDECIGRKSKPAKIVRSPI